MEYVSQSDICECNRRGMGTRLMDGEGGNENYSEEIFAIVS